MLSTCSSEEYDEVVLKSSTSNTSRTGGNGNNQEDECKGNCE